MKNQVTTKKVTAAKINAITAQAGALTVTVQTAQTRKASAKTIKALEPLVSAMNAINENTSAELLARLPQTTIAYKCFANQALGTASLFDWFDNNQPSLIRTTKDGKRLLNMYGAYISAFNITHDKARDGALKEYPFYKKFSNALQQWSAKKGGFEKRPPGAITDAIAAYLDKKEKEDSALLSDSIVVWVLKHEAILARIINSKALETPAA